MSRIRSYKSCQWLSSCLSLHTIAKISAPRRRYALINRSLVLPLVWHLQWYIRAVPFLPPSGLSTCGFLFWCQAPPHRSPKSMILLYRRGCAPTYPHHLQPMPGRSLSPTPWEKGFCSEEEQKHFFPQYYFWHSLRLSTSAIEKCVKPVLYCFRIFSFKCWKWLLRLQRDMTSNSWPKALRTLSILCTGGENGQKTSIIFGGLLQNSN